MIHHLKSWPELFAATKSGKKMFDLRRSHDRAFTVGDTVILFEYDKDKGYTGQQMTVVIDYITDTKNHCALSPVALDSNHCILGYNLPNKGPTFR